MTSPITLDMTVAEVAVRHPPAVEVFERLGVDYCCGGDTLLGQAAADAGVDATELMRALREAVEAEGPDGASVRNWSHATLAELADHIERRYHTFAREQLVRLERLLVKVRAVHGERHGATLRALDGLFSTLRRDLAAHLDKEEQVLFPMIRRFEGFASGREAAPDLGRVTIEDPIRTMRLEHDSAGVLLAQMRKLTGGFAAPSDACASFRALYDGLAALEHDLHEHIHLENNILFPRALTLVFGTIGA